MPDGDSDRVPASARTACAIFATISNRRGLRVTAPVIEVGVPRSTIWTSVEPKTGKHSADQASES